MTFCSRNDNCWYYSVCLCRQKYKEDEEALETAEKEAYTEETTSVQRGTQ